MNMCYSYRSQENHKHAGMSSAFGKNILDILVLG